MDYDCKYMVEYLSKPEHLTKSFMKLIIEIFNETTGYIFALFYTILGLFIRLPNSTEGEKNPVILIPGLMGSPLVFTKLRRQLIRNGYPVYTPWLSFQIGSFQDNARILEQFILDNHLKDIYIIGHSAGSMIVTQMGYKGRDRIKKFFAVSTPFHGTILAIFIYFFPAGRQLLRGSSFLKNNEINFMTFPNLQCLYSKFDLMIIPGFQGKIGRIDDIEYPGVGHINIIMSNRGVNFILDKLEREEGKNEKPKTPPSKSKVINKSAVKPGKKVTPEKSESKPALKKKGKVPTKVENAKKTTANKRAKKKV